ELGAAKSRSAHVMTARIVNAIARTIPTLNSNLAGFGFGAMGPLLARQIDVAMLDFRGAKRKRYVSYFTLRWLSKKCTVAKNPVGFDNYLGLGQVGGERSPAPGRGGLRCLVQGQAVPLSFQGHLWLRVHSPSRHSSSRGWGPLAVEWHPLQLSTAA